MPTWPLIPRRTSHVACPSPALKVDRLINVLYVKVQRGSFFPTFFKVSAFRAWFIFCVKNSSDSVSELLTGSSSVIGQVGIVPLLAGLDQIESEGWPSGNEGISSTVARGVGFLIGMVPWVAHVDFTEGVGHKIEDAEFAYALLESLPESWDTFVSAIADDIVANPTKLIARILAEDSRRRSRIPADPTTALPAVDMSKVKCFECGHFEHYASKHDQQQNGQQPQKNRSDRPTSNFRPRRGRQGKGKSCAHVAVDDASDNEDFGFLARALRISRTSAGRLAT
ncbi:hypothetical protein B0H13DRAFT_1869993 [Mycena leptocephala]|nr:hypothetical protein B0H13DRAFT_1869993 [Mycena leptocephala]